MTKPNPFEKLLGVQHGLISGAAGKPHSIVNVKVKNLVVEDPVETSFPEVFEEDPSIQTDSRPAAVRLKKFDTEAVLKTWARTVEDIAQRRSIDMKDLWAQIHCRGRGGALHITTRIHNDMIAARFRQKLRGSLSIYVRLMDLVNAVLRQDVPQFAVSGSMISYVAEGARHEFPFVENLTDNVVKPAAPPESGYTPISWLGTALSEASKWCSADADQYGRQAIRVIPRDDATGKIEIIAMRDSGGYRRLLNGKGLEESLVIVPTWLMQHEKLLGAHVGVRVSGRDYVWLVSASGVVLGLEMPELPWCTGYEEYFQGLDGRVEFTVDQVDAIRRGLVQLEPLAVQHPAIGITPTGSGVMLRGRNTSLECEGMGDEGEEILVNPDMLAEALKARSVRFLEFDKEDLEQYVRLTGPDVSVTIKPLTQPVA